MKLSIKRISLAAVSVALAVTSLFGCSENLPDISSSSADVQSDQSETKQDASAQASASSESLSSKYVPAEYKPAAKIDQTIYNIGMCVSESYYNDPVAIILQRLEYYKKLGIQTVRTGTHWYAFQGVEGAFNNPPEQVYFAALKQANMRVKMIAGTIMGVPGWYFNKYPNTKLINDIGVQALGSATYLAPNLRSYLTQALDKIMNYFVTSGLIDHIDSVVVDMGPAGEPLYPPAWTQKSDGLDNPSGEEHFWCYDPYMQADFVAAMKTRYGTIEKANKSWGKSFSSWNALSVPLPGTSPGKMWEDVLIWYRDVKRVFMEEQIKMFKAAMQKYSNDRIKLILYIPGSDIRDSDWQDAINTGKGNGSVMLMSDSKYIIQLADKYGCLLQYTGAENTAEVKYLMDYMKANSYDSIPIFGENAGGYDIGKNIKSFVNDMRRTGFSGVDLTHSRWIIANDRYSPNEYDERLRTNLLSLSEYLKSNMK